MVHGEPDAASATRQPGECLAVASRRLGAAAQHTHRRPQSRQHFVFLNVGDVVAATAQKHDRRNWCAGSGWHIAAGVQHELVAVRRPIRARPLSQGPERAFAQLDPPRPAVGY